MSDVTRSGPASEPESVSSSAAAARRDAPSPACAPPIPSATAKSGGATTDESSLRRRFLPVSLARAYAAMLMPAPSSLRSRLEPQLGLADAHHVTVDELARPVYADTVHVGAVRRAEVVHPDAVAARLDTDVPRRRELVGVDHHVVLAAPADRERRGVELV